jgi:hypothetical protein
VPLNLGYHFGEAFDAVGSDNFQQKTIRVQGPNPDIIVVLVIFMLIKNSTTITIMRESTNLDMGNNGNGWG